MDNQMVSKKQTGKLLSMLLIFVLFLMSACSSQGNNASSNEGTPNAGTPNAGTGEATVEKVTISTITGWPESDPTSLGYGLFVEKVKEKSGGAIEFTYRGGPESIPAFEQTEAVKNGVVDLAWGATSYYYNQMAEAAAYTYSELSAEEERANGAFELFNEINEKKMNLHILGRGTNPGPVIYTKVPVNSIEDFKGLRIRSAPAYVPVIEQLGADVITMPGGEIYSALERNIIDGFAWPSIGAVDMGVEKQIKYKVYPEFTKSDVVNMMNAAKWNSLPDNVKAILTESMIEVEKELPALFKELIGKEEETLKANGVEVLEFKEAADFSELAMNAGWEWIMEKSPEYGKQLEEKFRK